ncbi:MAG: hemolysin III family protein [Clostridium lundense]|nr:hemolysin III family protein [Clostridium lundense]
MLTKFREPISGLTHLIGAVISLVGMILLIWRESTVPKPEPLAYVAIAMFGLSLILLYTASTVYHLVRASEGVIKFLRKLDHSMIFVLIAGTYTPICLIALHGSLRWAMFIGIWACAIMGIVFKMVWFNAPRWISTLSYVLIGWISVFLIPALSKTMSIGGIVLLFLGGVSYTLGAVIYATKWPRIKSNIFGFHEIFHLFVMAGSFFHYFMVFKYML